MSEQIELLKNTLRSKGYSLTRARKQVFAALEQKEPQTINEITSTVAGQVNRASVYRILALFEKLGIVHRLQLGWKYKIELSDRFSYHHHHISCMVCGSVTPLREDVLLEASLRGLAIDYGYKPVAHQLEISGLCPDCRKDDL